MGRRLQARRDDAEARTLLRLTASYLAVFSAVIAAISLVAYTFIANMYRSIVAPALGTPEGQAGFAAAMRPALYAILSADGLLLLTVGAASYLLARAALRPLVVARGREERFAADVAHELRTPLGAITAIAQTAAPDDPHSARTALDSIARRALECGELVSDLLTLARASNAGALDREPVDLAIVTQLVIRDRTIAQPSIAVDGVFASAIVLGDERRLRQLVRNLLDNALNYAQSRVAIKVFSEGGVAHLSVEDDGAGVSAEVMPRLFQRFAKGPKSAGSGLGLAISRWVAHAHGGDVAFTGGSRFVAHIPLAHKL